MLLVTTRFAEVAKVVGTKEYFGLEYIELKGLEPEVFWDLFKLCVFESEDNHIDLQLEQIGRNIVPKLKGSPLAAKTIGRLLRKSLTTKHWNDILNSELWQLQQKETDILPALRLSYMYLPLHLKRCFSFCAVYPKDYNFQKDSLAEIWVAEGFVEPQGNIPLQHIGGQYFEELVNLSFFQELHSNYLIHDLMELQSNYLIHDLMKLHSKYVIHDLMHDMAQLVSKDECFIVKEASDFGKVPQNVRHLSILRGRDFNFDNLTSLCKHEKLRTLLCKESLDNRRLVPVINHWFYKLQLLRVVSLASARHLLPESIGNLKHLRYLEISRARSLMSLPSSFFGLYNLQILNARYCMFSSLPDTAFSNLINLQKFEAQVQKHTLDVDALDWGKTFWLLSNITIQDLIINNVGSISKDDAAKMGKTRGMKYLNCLTLIWSSLRSQEHIGIEVLQALNPSTNTSLKSLHLKGCPGEYLPRGSHSCNFPTSASPLFGGSDGPEENINQNEAPVMIVRSNNGLTGSIFPSLTELCIEGSEQLSSLEQFLQPDCVPAIKKIAVENCQRLSLQSAKVGDLRCLEELMVCNCPNIISGGVFAPYLKKLTLKESRNLGGNLMLVLNLEMWSLPALLEFKIIGLNSITFTREGNLSHHSGSNSSTGTLSSLIGLTIQSCSDLENFNGLLSHECLPSIRMIHIRDCAELQCLPCERFGSLSSLKNLWIMDCPRLNWQSGIVLPSSLEFLYLCRCGDISSWFHSCLDNLTSLQSLVIEECEHIVSIPGHMWRRNLPSLTELWITGCPNLESIGGPNAIAHLKWVCIDSCAKLKEIDQPFRRRVE